MEDSEDEVEGLEGNNPVTGMSHAAFQGVDASGGMGALCKGEEDYFLDQGVAHRKFFVGGGHEDGNLKFCGRDLCKGDACLILDGGNHLLKPAGHGSNCKAMKRGRCKRKAIYFF